MPLVSFRRQDEYLTHDLIYDARDNIMVSEESIHHVCKHKSMFTTFEALPLYDTDERRTVLSPGRGIVHIELAENVRLKLLNVLCAPHLSIGSPGEPAAVISWPRLRDAGCVRHIDRYDNWIITRGGRLVVYGILRKGFPKCVFRRVLGPALDDKETLRIGAGLVREPKGYCVDVGAVPVENINAGGHDVEEERTEVLVDVKKLKDGREAWLRKIEQSMVQAKDTETKTAVRLETHGSLNLPQIDR